MSSEIHSYLPFFDKEGEIYADLFGTPLSSPKNKIFDIPDLNQGAITNALEWHFGVKRNAVRSLNIRNASGVFLDVWGEVFGIKRPKGMVDVIYKDYLIRSLFDFNPTVVGLDVLSKKYGFFYRNYDEMGVYLDKSFTDVGVTNLQDSNYLFSSIIVDETMKRSYFLSANSMSVFGEDFLAEIQTEKPSGVELYLSETTIFQFLSFPETFHEAHEKAISGQPGYSVSKVEYDVDEFNYMLNHKEVTFHPIRLQTPYAVFETLITSLNMDKYFESFKDGDINLFYLVMRRTQNKYSDRDVYKSLLEIYPISSSGLETVDFSYPYKQTLQALQKDENIISLFIVYYQRAIDRSLLYVVTPIITNHGKKEFEDVPILVDVTWKYNFNGLGSLLNPPTPFFSITAPIEHNARATKTQNQFFNDGKVTIKSIYIEMKEDGGHLSSEIELDLNIFEANKHRNSKNVLGTAIAGVIVAKRTKYLYKNNYQMSLSVESIIKFEDGSIESPLNGDICNDRESFKIGTFDKDIIEFVYFPGNSGEIIFVESFGSFPNYFIQGKNGYDISKIIIDAPMVG